MGRLKENPGQWKVVQTAAPAQSDAEPFRDKMPYHFPPESVQGTSWPMPCLTITAAVAPSLSISSCGAWVKGGGNHRSARMSTPQALLRRRPLPSANGMWAYFQSLRCGRGRLALGQQADSVPAPWALVPESSAGVHPWHSSPIVRETGLSPSRSSPCPFNA